MDNEKNDHIQDVNELTPKKINNDTSKASRKRTNRLDSFELKTPRKKQKEELINTTDQPEAPSDQYQYSDLKYIESFGVLRMCRSKKSRNNHSVVGSSDDRTSNRSIQLQISYRVNINNDDDIQLALVVYEHVTKNPKIRRNLMGEFCVEKSNVENKQQEVTSPPLSDKKGDGKKSLKRLLF